MAGKRHDEGRLCPCDRRDGTCAGLVVRRLTPGRVQQLAEEIWAASLGDLVPARALPLTLPTRGPAAPAPRPRPPTGAGACRSVRAGGWIGPGGALRSSAPPQPAQSWSARPSATGWSGRRPCCWRYGPGGDCASGPLPRSACGGGRPRRSGRRPAFWHHWRKRATWYCTTSPCRGGWTASSTWSPAPPASGWWSPGSAARQRRCATQTPAESPRGPFVAGCTGRLRPSPSY
jgi:hypothetical protein